MVWRNEDPLVEISPFTKAIANAERQLAQSPPARAVPRSTSSRAESRKACHPNWGCRRNPKYDRVIPVRCEPPRCRGPPTPEASATALSTRATDTPRRWRDPVCGRWTRSGDIGGPQVGSGKPVFTPKTIRCGPSDQTKNTRRRRPSAAPPGLRRWWRSVQPARTHDSEAEPCRRLHDVDVARLLKPPDAVAPDGMETDCPSTGSRHRSRRAAAPGVLVRHVVAASHEPHAATQQADRRRAQERDRGASENSQATHRGSNPD